MDLFVRGIPFKMKETQLMELFEKYGEVSSATIVINKATRQNAGYGFVAMADDEQAKGAIEALDGFEIEGRKIQVSKSVPKEEPPTKAQILDRNKPGGRTGSARNAGKKVYNKEDKTKGGFRSSRENKNHNRNR
jgi:RNA recognition motif-containing protein